MALRSLRSLFLVLVTCVVALGAATSALAADAPTLIKQIEAKYAAVDSLKAQFTQTVRSAAFGDEVVAGELVVARPAKMRWSYGTERLFVTNGTKMWVYTAEERQVVEYDDISSSRSAADSLFTSLDKITEMFEVKVLSSDATGHQVELRPRDGAQFKLVQLGLDANLLVKRVVMTDSYGAVTELDFSAVQLNVKPDDALFTFTVPAGVDVVKSTTN
jgi:outer membrane lipoprotein carrier protein